MHIALRMRQEDKWGDVGGLMSGTGGAKQALHSGGLQAVWGALRDGTLPSSELAVVQFANWGQWRELSVLSHRWLLGTGQGAMCSTVVRQMEKRAGGSRGARHSCLLPLVLRATPSTHCFAWDVGCWCCPAVSPVRN